jgi:hypothetical protein
VIVHQVVTRSVHLVMSCKMLKPQYVTTSRGNRYTQRIHIFKLPCNFLFIQEVFNTCFDLVHPCMTCTSLDFAWLVPLWEKNCQFCNLDLDKTDRFLSTSELQRGRGFKSWLSGTFVEQKYNNRSYRTIFPLFSNMTWKTYKEDKYIITTGSI